MDSPPLSCARRLRSASAAGASAAAESPPRKVRAPKWRRKPGRTQKAPGAPITRRKQVPCRPEGSRTVGQHATPGRSPKTSPKKLHPGRQAPGARTRQFVCQHRQTTICLSATSRARRRLPGETHRRRGMERGEKVLARAAARPRGRGRGHRGPGHGQHGGLLGHARGARDEGTLKLQFANRRTRNTGAELPVELGMKAGPVTKIRYRRVCEKPVDLLLNLGTRSKVTIYTYSAEPTIKSGIFYQPDLFYPTWTRHFLQYARRAHARISSSWHEPACMGRHA